MDHTYLRPIKARSGETYQVTQADLNHLRARIDIDQATGCWNWTAGKIHGYGRATIIPGEAEYTHRVMFQLAGGKLQSGMHLDHLCRNPACCNPDHLEQVTPRENILRSPVGPSAINARKSHCDRGHEFTEENTRYVDGGKHRACWACQRQIGYRNQSAKRLRKRHEQHAAAVAAAGGPCLQMTARGSECTLPLEHSGRHHARFPLSIPDGESA